LLAFIIMLVFRFPSARVRGFGLDFFFFAHRAALRSSLGVCPKASDSTAKPANPASSRQYLVYA
jgi:hypothetical protein